MTHNHDRASLLNARQLLALFLAALILAAFVPGRCASGETASDDGIPVITSVGKSNVKVNGVKSRGRLVKYTIPVQLLQADPDFLALMTEAGKYIGYPYVYGGSKPETSFDCSGFVCWVYTQSGFFNTGRLGAKGLYSLCEDIPGDQARPGDLVFFEKTKSADSKGVTHVGIYVGNNMMLHAGDPIGFADLKSENWAKKLYGFGRLPKK